MVKKKQYCVYCGEENSIENEKCLKCKKKLNPKEHALLDYLKDKIKDDLKSNVEDKATSIIINYIKSHLYGLILTCSIVISTTSVIVNATINNEERLYQKVEEKPTIVNKQITYQGVGLTAREVLDIYVEAIENDNQDKIKSLRLETFYPDIVDELKNKYQTDSTLFDTFPAFGYDFANNRNIYLKQNKSLLIFEESEILHSDGNFSNYSFQSFLVVMGYCSYNTCGEKNKNISKDAWVREEIQLIEIDGNYYVLGEKIAMMMGINEAVNLAGLIREDGDTTNLSFTEIQTEFDSCNLDEACLKEHGLYIDDIINQSQSTSTTD